MKRQIHEEYAKEAKLRKAKEKIAYTRPARSGDKTDCGSEDVLLPLWLTSSMSGGCDHSHSSHSDSGDSGSSSCSSGGDSGGGSDGGGCGGGD